MTAQANSAVYAEEYERVLRQVKGNGKSLHEKVLLECIRIMHEGTAEEKAVVIKVMDRVIA